MVLFKLTSEVSCLGWLQRPLIKYGLDKDNPYSLTSPILYLCMPRNRFKLAASHSRFYVSILPNVYRYLKSHPIHCVDFMAWILLS